MSGAGDDSAFWGETQDALIARLDSSASGLTSTEAQARLLRFGANSFEDDARLGALRLFLRQYESPLVLILVFGAIVSLAVKEWVEAFIILFIVAGSTLLGFFQEWRASTAVAELRNRLALNTHVLRDGKESVIPASSIVPGDVVLLSAGNLVPADGLILDARDFLVSESSLTGESFPVEKQKGTVPASAPISQRSNSAFLGSSVRSGTASILVAATGRKTAFGAIASSLRIRAPDTEFANGVRQFGYLLIRVMVVMVLFVLTVNGLLHRPFVESLLFAVALAVGLSPELLPAIVSVTLSAGARAMSKEGVIVRRLEAIENLGSMNILCTDKTGTLTEGNIVLKDAVDCFGVSSSAVRTFALLNAAFETGIENPLDRSILEACKADLSQKDAYEKIDEIPYDFLRKRLTIVVRKKSENAHIMITKGAFPNILAGCSHVDRGGEVVALNRPEMEKLEAYYRDRGSEGFRVLAVATRSFTRRATYARADESGMIFMGFLLFFDPPKKDAAETVAALGRLGVRIKVISGDSRYVTAHLAQSIGLNPQSSMTGEELKDLKDEALWHRAPRTDLFVEIDPQQKERIVLALKHAGNAVGFMGDGINDAPALHAADVGISVDQASDVARQSADIVLLERDLGVLKNGIEGGRRTFTNTLKYISITTSANFGNMISMSLATPLLPFLPLTAAQILLNNFLSDIPSIAISSDNVGADRIAAAQRWDIRTVRKFMVLFGLISSVFDILTFAVLLWVFKASIGEFQTVWFVVSLLTELTVVFVLRTRGPAIRSQPSRLLLWSSVVIFGVALAIPCFAFARELFGFVPIPPLLFAVSLCIVLAYLSATEAAKLLLFRR